MEALNKFTNNASTLPLLDYSSAKDMTIIFNEKYIRVDEMLQFQNICKKKVHNLLIKHVGGFQKNIFAVGILMIWNTSSWRKE